MQNTVSNMDPNSLTSTVRKQWGFENAGDMDLGSTGSKALHDTHALLNVRDLLLLVLACNLLLLL